MTTLSQIKTALENYSQLNDELDLQALDCTYNAEPESEIDLQEFQEQAGDYIRGSVQVIYYSKAIDFLKENDASLQTSMALAAEFCTPLDKITSEFLASILLQDICQQELCELISELSTLESVAA